MINKRLFARTGLWIVPFVCSLIVVGCDNSVDPGSGTTRSVEGYATDNDGYGKRAARIEGATVTAANIDASGGTHALSASTTTNASGEYTLEISDPSPIVRVTAEKDDYHASALVYVEGEGTTTVQAQPINTETKAEADVYVEAKGNGNEQFTAADAALYVNQELAGQIESGATTTSEAAAAINGSVDAESAFISETDAASEESIEQSADLKTEAFASFQSDVATAGDSQGQASVVASFRSSVRQAYVDAGVPIDVYAKARQTAHSTIELETGDADSSSDALFGLRHASEMTTAAAVAHAIEAAFEAQNASQSRLDALADARAQLIADLGAATTVDAMEQAQSDYESTVEGELAAALEVNSSAVAGAQESLSEAAATLESALTLNVSASAAAQAHTTYYSSAESMAASSLEASENARLGGKVVTLLTLQ